MSAHPIAYFCAEYGLDHRLPIYAGGLGVLAGDTLKAAADLDLDFIGVGLLYQGKKAVQLIDEAGHQYEQDLNYDPLSLGLKLVKKQSQPLLIKVFLKDHFVWARVWQKPLSQKTWLLLLDTKVAKNTPEDQQITDSLYFGDPEKQLQQQFMLGIGGVKVLQELGIEPQVFHLNEGRPAFLSWQLIAWLMEDNQLTFDQVVELAKDYIAYTNHTLVAAGNYFVSLELLADYAAPVAQRLGTSVKKLLEPGMVKESFSMTDFALNSSAKHSGVSKLHTQLSQKIWPSYNWQAITNGVHLPTWQDERLSQAKIKALSADELWQIHQDNKQQLAKFVLERTGFKIDAERLIIGWARRLAGYKRLDAVFADVHRLANILKNQDRPVQLLVAGRAHQQDQQAKLMFQQIIKYMAKQLSGHALFIPNYDLAVAKHLIRGCDVWLNVPERGQEACGTSGMKAISNGVLQCTTLDGWTDQVDWSGLGWIVNNEKPSQDLYHLLETQIGPLYYEAKHAAHKSDQTWLKMMRASINLAQDFSAKRMLQQYQQLLYPSA